MESRVNKKLQWQQWKVLSLPLSLSLCLSCTRVLCAASSGKQRHVKGVAGSAVWQQQQPLQQQQQQLQQELQQQSLQLQQQQQQPGLPWSGRVGGSCAGKCGKTMETVARAQDKAATM